MAPSRLEAFVIDALDVLMVAPFAMSPKGTVQARLLPLAKALARRGHRVQIIIPPYDNVADSERVERQDGVTIRNLKASGRPLRDLWSLPRQVLGAIRRGDADIVHLFKPKGYGGLALEWILRRRAGVRAAIVVDEDDWEGRGGMNDTMGYSWPERRMFAHQERWLLRHADAVTCASLELKRRVEALRRDGRGFFIPNGQSTVERAHRTPSAARMAEGIPDRATLLVYSRFFEFPIERLQAIVETVLRAVPAAQCLVVGAGRQGEEERLRKELSSRGLGQRIIVLGFQPAARLRPLVECGDVALYPFADTLINRTKCPAKLTELMRSGVPVVANRVGMLAHYVVDKETGILVDDDPAIAQQAAGLLQDPDRAQRMGAAAHDRIASEFDWAKLAPDLEDAYAYAMEAQGVNTSSKSKARIPRAK